MKYKKYPSYKDSGVEWLGEIPSSWKYPKLKYYVSVFGRIGYRGYTVADIVDTGQGAITLSPSNIIDNKMNYNKSTYLSWDKYEESPEIQVEEGDIVFVKTASIGKIGFIDKLHEKMTLNPQLVVFKKIKCHPKYLYFLFNSSYIKANIDNSNTGGTIATMSQENLLNYTIPLPLINEQQQIANFLDKATAKIDILIEKQTKQIGLLKEKRQAVISHAVTKGINPNVKLKYSDVEWLGDVPEHWEVTKLKYKILKLESGTSVNAADIPANENEYGVLKTSCVYTEKFRHNENKTVVEEEIYRLSCPLQKNTLIVSRMNTPELVGAAGYVQNAHINIFLPDRLWQVYFTCNTRLIHYITLTKLYRNYIKTVCDGTSSSMQNLTQEDFKDFVCALPFSFDEQKEIVNYLDDKTSKIDTLIEKSKKSIELLKEKRTALISACVTGKIDVRELV